MQAVRRTVLCPCCAGRPPHCPPLPQHRPLHCPLSLLCRPYAALSSAPAAPPAAPSVVLVVQAVRRTVLCSRSTALCAVLCPRCVGRPPRLLLLRLALYAVLRPLNLGTMRTSALTSYQMLFIMWRAMVALGRILLHCLNGCGELGTMGKAVL